MEKQILNQVELLSMPYRNRTFFGGAQEWYPTFWQRQSGCGPTTASNALAYMALRRPALAPLFPERHCTHSAIVKLMNTMWNYVKPTLRGVYHPSMLAEGTERYARERGVALQANYLEIPSSKKEAFFLEKAALFIQNSLQKDSPLAFLNLSKGALTNLDSWHWVLIVGASRDSGSLWVTIYDEGIAKDIDFALWLSTTEKGGGLVSFC